MVQPSFNDSGVNNDDLNFKARKIDGSKKLSDAWDEALNAGLFLDLFELVVKLCCSPGNNFHGRIFYMDANR